MGQADRDRLLEAGGRGLAPGASPQDPLSHRQGEPHPWRPQPLLSPRGWCVDDVCKYI